MNAIFDSHAHYDDEAFDEDREELLAALPCQNVCAVVNAASDLASSRRGIALSERYPYFWAAVGVHPQEAGRADLSELEEIKRLAGHPRVVAIGEIGLDYHYDEPARDLQADWFEEQLALAKELDLPVIVHDRDAHEDVFRLLRRYQPKGVVHCFSGSAEMAKEIVRLGMYIGLGGAVTFKNARRPVQVAAAIPPDRLLLETDAPYMTPVPLRGKRNRSDYLAHTAARLADIRGVSPDDIYALTRENACRLFGIAPDDLL
ncbi:MAG: TatD family hydrolase [Clostridiales bacterium]|nr:TatD family hydrolase [Clostridiales bacterium]